jgi:hypothetical protein
MDHLLAVVKKILWVLVPLVAVYASVTVIINIKFPEAVIKEKVNEYFKNNINKAVKFDSIDVSPFSKLVINNFKISNGNDFNDNLPLISCKKFTIDFSLFSVFSGKPSITAFRFDNPDINFIKPYGKNYGESVYRSFTDVTHDIFVRIIKDGRILEIENGKITYKEMFPEEEQTFVVDKLNITLTGGDREGSFNCDGRIKNNKTNTAGYGAFQFEGRFEVDANGNLVYSSTSVNFDSIDLSYINPYLKNIFTKSINAYGQITGNVEIKSFYGTVINQTALKLENVKITGENAKVLYVNDKNFSAAFQINRDSYGAVSMMIKATPESLPEINVSVRRFSGTKNDVNNLLLCFDMPQSSISQYNKIITPIPGFTFLGKINAYAKIMCDIRSGRVYDVISDLKLKDAEVRVKKTGVLPFEKITLNLDSKVTNNNSVNCHIYGNADSTDFSFAVISFIKNWNPLFSDNTVTYESDVTDFKHLYFVFNRIKSDLSRRAYDDLSKGYKEINFRERNYGKFINNNNFDIGLKIGLLKLEGNAACKGLNARVILLDGSLKSQPLLLRGYNAVYNFSIESFLKSDFPKLTCSLEIKNFDFAGYHKDTGREGELTDAVFNYKEEVELTGHSPGHIIENGHFTRSFTLTAKKADKTLFQSQSNDVCKANNLDLDAASLENVNIAYDFGFNNGIARLRSLNFSSNKISFSVAGNYDYKKGYDLPFNVSFRDAGGKPYNEKFVLTGFNKNDGLLMAPSSNNKTTIRLY